MCIPCRHNAGTLTNTITGLLMMNVIFHCIRDGNVKSPKMQQLLHSTSYLINCAENINLFNLFNEPAIIVCWQGYVPVYQLVCESVATASR